MGQPDKAQAPRFVQEALSGVVVLILRLLTERQLASKK